jgi:voltage-gated potassium channel
VNRTGLRHLRAVLRDTWVLVREFRSPLALFVVTLLVGGWSFGALWRWAGHAPMLLVEAIYDVLMMIFFQPSITFPQEWYLQIYFFLMPVLGLVILGRGVADFTVMLFNRSLRQEEWEAAVASTFKNHIIVCGLGNVGIRVVRELTAAGEDVVIIEKRKENPNFDEARSYGYPVLVGDARDDDLLHQAGLKRAESFIVCTNDDLMNIQIAIRVRQINPEVRLVMRMFDDVFAREMTERFHFSAVLSASALAAPAFAGAATGTEILQTFQIGEMRMSLSRLVVCPKSRLDGATIGEVEEEFDLSIVVWQSGDVADDHPPGDVRLKADDTLTVLATTVGLAKLSRWNRKNG